MYTLIARHTMYGLHVQCAYIDCYRHTKSKTIEIQYNYGRVHMHVYILMQN